ncbi:MAG: phosphoglyceromutase [Maribacter sp.]|nr:MAG: phosphoglyceromutase [Maribacter sp.]
MKNKLVITYLFLQLGLLGTYAQKDNTKVVLITLDGFRWQELFTGADPLLVTNKAYVHDTTKLRDRFWRETAEQRREALLPFIWGQVVDQGQIHGNRTLGSKVDLTNQMWFSYPGYNEILTGKADDARIDSNEKFNNPNTTILEIANKDVRYKGKVVAFCSWDVFPFIINEERSGVPVNAGFDLAEGDNISDREQFLNKLQPNIPILWSSVRMDVFTHNYAIEEMRKSHPRLLYISYGETDDFAHEGNYGSYLNSAHTTDGFIKELWELTQQDPFYKDQTLFVVTTDHGRGTVPLETWKSHGSKIDGAGSVWMVLFGKGVSGKGEIANKEQLYSNQIAPTILKALNLEIPSRDMPGKALDMK